jgi:hypothetical protein
VNVTGRDDEATAVTVYLEDNVEHHNLLHSSFFFFFFFFFAYDEEEICALNGGLLVKDITATP